MGEVRAPSSSTLIQTRPLAPHCLAWSVGYEAVMIEVPGYVLVHAGLRPGVAPKDQNDQDLRWYRHDPEAAKVETDYCVVHGHTIVETPIVTPTRIAIDTGAYASGRLTAVCLRSGQEPIIIEQSGPSQHK